MLKILILSHRFNPDVGGIETNSELLAEAFHDRGAEVQVLTWTKQPSAKQFPFAILRNPGISTIIAAHRWADVVLENNPCLRLSWPNLFIRRPLVIALNTWVKRLQGYKGTRDWLKLLWFRRATSLIAVSDALRRIEWPKAAVIENPYNDRLFKTTPGAARTTPFIFLGRLVSDKGADLAIEAVKALLDSGVQQRSGVQLTIVGDGPEKGALEQLVHRYGLGQNVCFTGVLTGAPLVEMLNRHRFILVPSRWEEPYGNVVLEGMACGCIPIASNGGGLPEAVGAAGILFERNNLDSMVQAIKTILMDESKIAQLQDASAQHLQLHAVDVVAGQYYKMLKAAAGSC